MGDGPIANLRGSSQQAGNLVPQHVLITDTSGTPINSFGGGTQYTEGDVDSSLTGTVAMAEGPSNTVYALQTDAAGNLKTINGLMIPAWDYWAIATVTATKNRMTFKTGGSGGTTVAVVDITYSSAAEATAALTGATVVERTT